MAINEQLTQINEFSKGMLPDISDANISEGAYKLANNLRYITDDEENTSELHLIEGDLLAFNSKRFNTNYTVRGATQIREYGIIIVENKEKQWFVYKFKNPYSETNDNKLDDKSNNRDFHPISNMLLVFGPCEDLLGENKLSLVTRYEDEDNIKLYIADGKHSLMCINITQPIIHTDIRKIISYPTVIFKKPIFCGIISGSLKSGLILYSYLFYNKNGNKSDISPTTKLIPIHKYNIENVHKIDGYEQGSITDKGVKLKIKIDDYASVFSNMFVYRITYVENGQLPTIEIIYDGKIKSGDNYILDVGQKALLVLTLEEYNSATGIKIIPKVIESKDDHLFAANIKTDSEISYRKDIKEWDSRAFCFNKNGETHLYDFTTNAVTKYTIADLPYDLDIDAYNKYLDINIEYDENNPEYDNPENEYYGANDRYTADGKYYGGTGKNISWKFILTELSGDLSEVGNNDNYSGRTGSKTPYITYYDENEPPFTNQIKTAFIKSDGQLELTSIINHADFFDTNVNNSTYANPSISCFLKSLRRDEIYRYGIVLYDNKGSKSATKWIADIRVPNLNWTGFNTFVSHGHAIGTDNKTFDLNVRPIGILFIVNNLPKDVVGYEIVRCGRSASDIATISQGVISRPIKRIWDLTAGVANSYPLTPIGLLTTNGFVTGWKTYHIDGWLENEDADYGWIAMNNKMHTIKKAADSIKNEPDFFDGNLSTYLFISPEVSYQKDSIKSILNDRMLLVPQLYLFGSNYNDTTEDFRRKTSDLYIWTDAVGQAVIHSSDFNDPSNKQHITKANQWIYPGADDYIKLPAGGYSYAKPNTTNTDVIYNKDVYNNDESLFIHGRGLRLDTLATTFAFYDKDVRKHKTTNGIFSFQFHSYLINIDSSDLQFDKFYEHERLRYSYIKLYESTNNVVTNNIDDNPLYTMNEYYDRQLLANNKLNKIKLNIKSTAYPNTQNWDDFASADAESNGTHSLKYLESVTSIGSYNYNSWVSGGLYKASFDNESNGMSLNNSRMDDSDCIEGGMMGPSGTCMLIDVQDDGVFDLNRKLCSALFAINKYETTDATLQNIYLKNADLNKYVPYGNISLNTNAAEETGSGSLDVARISGNNTLLFRESLLGTFLCNIRQSITPYGGYDAQSRELCTYNSYGDYFESNNTVANVFDGDCFIQPFEYISLHKWYSPYLFHPRNACIVYSIPVETNINLVYDYGYSFSKVLNESNEDVSDILETAQNVNNKFIQDKPMYLYNGAYSTNSNVRQHSAFVSLNENELNNLDYRCYFSDKKENNEIIDSWLKFMPANYLDVDTRNGAITNLNRFHNALVFWQEQATGLFSVNERITTTDDSNMPLMLGSGGVLSRYDYLNTSNGMHHDLFANAQSDSTLYWWDYNKHELCAYAGGQDIVVLSKIKYVQNLFNKLYNRGEIIKNPTLIFDKKYNELIANVSSGRNYESGSIVYSEAVNQFISLYGINPNESIEFKDRLYLIDKDSNIYEWNNIDLKYGSRGFYTDVKYSNLLPYLRYTVNKNAQLVKTFDNQHIAGRFYGGDKSNISNLKLSYYTPLKQQSDLNGDLIENREYDFRLAIPRNNNSLYGDRMRGKTMLCELKSSINDYDFSLLYIITKYRISWS